MAEFIKGIAETALEPNELAIAIHLKSPPEHSESLFLKHISSSEFSIASVAALCANPNKPESRAVRFAYGAVAPTPARVHEVEELFKRRSPIPQLIDEAVGVVRKSTEPMADVLAKAEYRSHMLEVLSIKAFSWLLGS
jgi:CO/xanthine dehydrogenase FAD-binding subunit